MQQSKAVRITGTAMLALTVLFCVLPFLSMLSAALQPQGSMPEGIQFTAHPHWENFIDAWNMANITPLLLNSCILVIVVVPCVVIFCSLGGYAFAQLKVPCKGLIYVLFLVGLTIPFETLVTPLYYEISGMGLLNTRLALILPLIGLNIPFGIVWMRSCFEQMPRDLLEAASIDGAGHLRTFRSIQLPLALPAISSLGILTFLATWNQFLLAVVLERTTRTSARWQVPYSRSLASIRPTWCCSTRAHCSSWHRR